MKRTQEGSSLPWVRMRDPHKEEKERNKKTTCSVLDDCEDESLEDQSDDLLSSRSS